MDRLKFTSIAHAQHQFYSPISSAKVNEIIELFDLKAGDKVLDVGCGRAEVLMQICERYQANGVGVDINPEFIRLAEESAKERSISQRMSFLQKPVQECEFEAGSFAAAICMGSLHAFGDYQKTLQAFLQLVRPGGLVLIGEGYWKKEPAPEYLEFLDATVEDHVPHARNIAIAEELGLVPLYALTSNQDEWDEYEGLYCRAIELYTHANPQDPDSPAMQERIRNWRKAYYQWGRETLGFGLYLFLRP